MKQIHIKEDGRTIYLPFIILSGVTCNSACIMCVVKDPRPNNPSTSTDEIIKDIIRGRKEGYFKIVISGGEPTLRKDLIYFIEQAKKLGYKEIGICTNGILLSDKNYCDKLVNAGLSDITFSVFAHNKEIHETITRILGSFEKTIKGIKNAVSHKNLEITATSVILKQNHKYFYQIGELISTLGIRYWKISDLLPNFLSNKQYSNLCISKKKTLKALYSLKLLKNEIELFTFYGFTPCTLPPDLREIKNFRWVTSNELFKVGQFVRYVGSNISDESLVKIDICKNCIFFHKCAGVWKRYFENFGDEEIRTLAVKHGCIKNTIGL